MNFPKQVKIVEVCPRDGFQNVKDFIQTEKKIHIIKQLLDTGLEEMEITSFVNPKAIPQLADAMEVVKAVRGYSKNTLLTVLVPNLRGMESAVEAGVDCVTTVVSVSERHNMENIRRTTDESLAGFVDICKIKGKIQVKLALATTFGCPFGEEIKTEKIIRMASYGLEQGADRIMLADTVGLCDPALMDKRLGEIVKVIPPEKIALHLHDTRGLSLANTIVAMQHGITEFESAAGGLGGCPFAPGASGNVSTEDLMNMLDSMGIAHKGKIEDVLKIVDIIRQDVHAPIASHMAALSPKCCL